MRGPGGRGRSRISGNSKYHNIYDLPIIIQHKSFSRFSRGLELLEVSEASLARGFGEGRLERHKRGFALLIDGFVGLELLEQAPSLVIFGFRREDR